jgi:hypothetical protein
MFYNDAPMTQPELGVVIAVGKICPDKRNPRVRHSDSFNRKLQVLSNLVFTIQLLAKFRTSLARQRVFIGSIASLHWRDKKPKITRPE